MVTSSDLPGVPVYPTAKGWVQRNYGAEFKRGSVKHKRHQAKLINMPQDEGFWFPWGVTSG